MTRACVMWGEEQFDKISLLPPSLLPQPNYIRGVTADAISSLPLWEGTIFLPIFLPPVAHQI